MLDDRAQVLEVYWDDNFEGCFRGWFRRDMGLDIDRGWRPWFKLSRRNCNY